MLLLQPLVARERRSSRAGITQVTWGAGEMRLLKHVARAPTPGPRADGLASLLGRASHYKQVGESCLTTTLTTHRVDGCAKSGHGWN